MAVLPLEPESRRLRATRPASRGPRPMPRRVAVLSVHTSPLDQPGTGDAGGMNVYVVELAKRLAAAASRSRSSPAPRPATCRRTSSSRQASPSATSPPARSRAWPRRTCPGRCAPSPPACCAWRPAARGLLRPRALALLALRPGRASSPPSAGACRSSTPCTRWPRSRTSTLAEGDRPEPAARSSASTRSSTPPTASSPTPTRRPASSSSCTAPTPPRSPSCTRASTSTCSRPWAARGRARRWGCAADAVVLLFVGRIQPLKAPDVLVRAVAAMVERDPSLRATLQVVVCGGPSGTGPEHPHALQELAASLGVADLVRFVPPVDRVRPRRLVPRGRPHGGAVVLRVVRARRRRGPGLRHPGRRRPRRRPAHRGRRRRQRRARRRPRPRRLGRRALPRCRGSAWCCSGCRRPPSATRRVRLGRHRRRHARGLPRRPRRPQRPPRRRRLLTCHDARPRGTTPRPCCARCSPRTSSRARRPTPGHVRRRPAGRAQAEDRLLARRRRARAHGAARSSRGTSTRTPRPSTAGCSSATCGCTASRSPSTTSATSTSSGRLPLASVTPDEVDRLLGSVLEYADGSFNTILELGFASAIKREYAWRVSRASPRPTSPPSPTSPTPPTDASAPLGWIEAVELHSMTRTRDLDDVRRPASLRAVDCGRM